MVMVSRTCPVCKGSFEMERGQANRCRARGYRPRCSMVCAGKMRRNEKTLAKKKAEKAAYDREYRAKNLARIKAEKAARCRTPHGRMLQRAHRQRMKEYHKVYCRRPEQRAKETARRWIRTYGPMAEIAKAAYEIRQEVIRRVPDKYTRLKERGYYAHANEKRKEKRRYATESKKRTG